MLTQYADRSHNAMAPSRTNSTGKWMYQQQSDVMFIKNRRSEGLFETYILYFFLIVASSAPKDRGISLISLSISEADI
jgi:hypothetical protein